MSTPPDPPPSGEHQDPQASAAAGPPPHQGEPHCPRCGAPHDPLQEYCLECGLRLVPLPGRPYMRSIVWSRESPVWLWLALAALLLVALAAGGIVALAATDDDGNEGAGGVSSLQTTTGGVVTTLPTTISVDTFTTPSTITLPTTSTLATTTTQPTTSTQPTTTGTSTIISWPSGEDGYTIVLKSTPTSQGRGPAESAAQQAINAGLPQVGILSSSDYSSLNPGYYVTFSGVYDTQSQAQSGLANARSKGFPTAYVRRVAD